MESEDVKPVEAADTEVELQADTSEHTDGAAVAVKNKHWRLTVFFKTFGFLLLVLATLSALYFGGRPDIPGATHTYRTYTLNKMFSERKNSLDVLYVGHSGVLCGVSPMELYEEYGIAGYDCSQELFVPWEAYETTVDILEEQKPKVIALEVDMFFYDNTRDLVNSNFKRFALCLFPFRETHSYWRDGFKRSERDYKKSFSINGKVKDPKYPVEREYSDKTYTLKKAHKKYLDAFNALCKEKDIKLALFYLPSLRYWSYDKYNFFKKFAVDNGLDFFDMNVDPSVATDADANWSKTCVNIDWSCDSRDGGDHLNYYGAVKSTHALGEWLKAKYGDIPDRRGDKDYEEWNGDLVKYKAEVEEKLNAENNQCSKTTKKSVR